METAAFYIFGLITVAASIGVIGQRNPMYSVLLLIASFGGLAGLYLILDAPFSAVTQIIIYAGAIMVLFLFVVMLLNASREEPAPGGIRAPRAMKFGVVLSVLLAIEALWAVSRLGIARFDEGPAETVRSVRNIGRALFTDHAFAFEATSILILVAMVGAVVLARKER